MNDTETIKIYTKSFSGIIDPKTLVFVRENNYWNMYLCPCGGQDHTASRAVHKNKNGEKCLADILHCYPNGRKWLITTNESDRRIFVAISTDEREAISNTIFVSNALREEEEMCLKMLKESQRNICKYMNKVKRTHPTPNDLFVLHATYGYPPSVVENIFGDIKNEDHDRYLELLLEHKRISKAKKGEIHE